MSLKTVCSERFPQLFQSLGVFSCQILGTKCCFTFLLDHQLTKDGDFFLIMKAWPFGYYCFQIALITYLTHIFIYFLSHSSFSFFSIGPPTCSESANKSPCGPMFLPQLLSLYKISNLIMAIKLCISAIRRCHRQRHIFTGCKSLLLNRVLLQHLVDWKNKKKYCLD